VANCPLLTLLFGLESKVDKALEEKLTNGGRVPLPVGMNLNKLVKADEIVGGIRKGDPMAVAEFKKHLGVRFGETLTTGDDFIFAFAQLTALQVDTQFAEADRTWSQAIDVETVSSFEAPKVYSIDYDSVTGFARPETEPGKPSNVAPIVPEGSPYPGFNFGFQEAASGAIHKSGGRFNLSFEKIVADPGVIVPQLPGLITEFLLDREEYDAWSGLLTFIDNAANHLAAATNLDGTTVPVDSPLNRASLAAALSQARLAEINGRKARVASYNVIVPLGQREVAEFYINNYQVTGAVDGSLTVQFPGYNPLSGIAGVVESEYFTGTQWALIPAKGAVRGNKKFYGLGRLLGHEGPEVRIQDVTGNYAGGGSVSPFEGSFETDSASMRGRIISGGLGWNPEYAIISDGDGV